MRLDVQCFVVDFFWLLSSSLLLWVETQCFSRCILLKARAYSDWNIISMNNNKDEDNCLKNHSQKKLISLLTQRKTNKTRHRINTMDYNKLILVEQHFCSNSHDFNRNAKFTIERIKKKQIRQYQNDCWNRRLVDKSISKHCL